jgi:replicative DNA helicase
MIKPSKLNELPVVPYSYVTEQAILNILLTNSAAIKKVLPLLKSGSFYFEAHRIIYQLISELYENDRVINVTTVISNLQDKQLLSKIGGIEQIILILNRFENFTNLDEYLKIVNEKYLRRFIIEFGKQSIAWGYNSSLTFEQIFEKLENELFKLNQEKSSEKLYSVGEIIDDIFLEMESKLKKTETFSLKSSFFDLDSIIQGFEKSDLIIIAGRPSMGKTAFSLNLGKNIVEKYGIPMIIFSLEMSRQQILYRFISSHSEINMSRLKSGKMTVFEWQKLSSSLKEISRLPIFIDDNPEINLIEIRSKIKKVFQQKKKNGLIIIDYLQLMKSNFKIENRTQEISHITRSLKIIAKEFEIPIIVLSQLSRGLESRVNKRPMLSDLRESGCIHNPKPNGSFRTKSWEQNKIYPSVFSSMEFKGLKPTYILHFENNIQISLTGNHRLLSKQGWIKITQINQNSTFYSIQKKNGKDLVNYCKLKKIEYDGLNNVYEKTIPIYHNYLHENFVMHNSIEQDADIVIMLYREDYYNEKKNSNQITELIVAKHRNGPVGTARLMFNPYFTKFTGLKEKD